MMRTLVFDANWEKIASTLKVTCVSLIRVTNEEQQEIISWGYFPKDLADAGTRLKKVSENSPTMTFQESLKKIGLIRVILAQTGNASYWLLAFRKPLFLSFTRRPNMAGLNDLESYCLKNEIALLDQQTSLLTEETKLAISSINALLAGFQKNGVTSTQTPFEVTLKYLLKLFSLEHGSIWELHDEQYLTLESTSNCEVSKYKKNCLEKPNGLVWSALEEGSPKINIKTDINADMLENVNLFDLYRDRPTYLIRLGEDDNPLGVACLTGKTPTKLDISKTTILTIFEKFLTLELQSRRVEQNAIFFKNIPKLLRHQTYDIEKICDTACECLLGIMSCQAVSIFLKPNLEVVTDRIELLSSKLADNVEPSEHFRKFKSGTDYFYLINIQSLTGTVALTEKSLISNRVSKDKKNSFIFREAQDHSNDTWVGVPIITPAGACLGVLRCAGKKATIQGATVNYIFDKFDASLLSYAASVLAPLIQHAQTAQEVRGVNERLAKSEIIREHEMRGPLQLIQLHAEFIKSNLHDEAVTTKEQKVQDIITNVELCAMVLTSTKLPSREDFKKLVQPLGLRALLKVLADSMRHQIESRAPAQIFEDPFTGEMVMRVVPHIVIELIGNCPMISAHRYLLQRAFYNIVNNAVKYAKWAEKGRIRITLKEDLKLECVYVIFEDYGIGVPAEEIDYIFSKRFRGKCARERPGEGIGLKIAKSIIEIHGGTLAITNSVNPTCFSVSLPINQP